MNMRGQQTGREQSNRRAADFVSLKKVIFFM